MFSFAGNKGKTQQGTHDYKGKMYPGNNRLFGLAHQEKLVKMQLLPWASYFFQYYDFPQVRSLAKNILLTRISLLFINVQNISNKQEIVC